MVRYRAIVIWILSLFLVPCCIQAEQWTTYFAYNNVIQIAMAPDRVYALSDGSLFSVDKQTEQIRIYNRQSGLHSTGISCIHYDEVGQQLIIAYETGKIDILSSKGVKYISELYDKDMTQRKTIYNVTIHGRMAYLSTHYGVQTMDLRENKLVDSYWLRPGGEETPVKDVVIQKDSIYAFTDDSMFCASMKANLVDYIFWKREQRSGRVSPNADKGVHYKDETSQWYAGNAEGIIRFTATERLTYKPQGPQTNNPYRLTATQGQVWMVQGGRWAVQNQNAGIVMHFDGDKWTYISSYEIREKTGIPPYDFMNVAVDPKDKNHYYVTSYGTGLYEFRNNQVVNHYLGGAEGTTLESASPSNPAAYTRVDYAQFDQENRLWVMNAGNVSYQLNCLDTDGQWHGIPIVLQNERQWLPTPGGLLFDTRHPNYKWIACARSSKMGLYLLDDNGTPFDASDDRLQFCKKWTDQYGRSFEPASIYDIMQDDLGRIWLATDQGAAYIDSNTDFFTSDAILRPDVTDENDENPMTILPVSALCQSRDGNIWVGTESLGVYVLTADGNTIQAHYTTDNSALPSNGILSLAADEQSNMYIGSSEGLVMYNPNATSTEAWETGEAEEDLDMGRMHQWKLHLSYNSPSELVATPQSIYAMAQGALFSYDRTDGTIDYWNRSTGLNGNTIIHIAYDKASGNLIIAYNDGRIDLLNDKGEIRQMPDLYMKAGSVSVAINSISVGSKYVYLAMPFGILATLPEKGEVYETYYIGNEATDVDVQYVVEKGDSLYAFSYDRMYSAALKDNLIDYHFWHISPLTLKQLQHVAVYENRIYTLQHDSLYRYTNAGWKLVREEPFAIMHASEGKLLLISPDRRQLYNLTKEEKLELVNDQEAIDDAIYTQGEYWLGERDYGLIHISGSEKEHISTSGPNSNYGYCLHAAHGRIYSTIGGRWEVQYKRPSRINIYDMKNWFGINEWKIATKTGSRMQDACSIAVDPKDPGHFFTATYGMGVLEFRDYAIYERYTPSNSTLEPYNNTLNPERYTRTDGAMMDAEGNLWVLNATQKGHPVHILTPDGQWKSLPLRVNGNILTLTTPAGIWTDRRSNRRKWFIDQRSSAVGIILLDDGGTPTYSGDDRCIKRNTLVDQNGTNLSPAQVRCFAQDLNDRIWIGTDKGILTIEPDVDFFQSNACRRIIIPRNDGTGLGDYLLGEEQINCMAVDSGNRMWIGTAYSGLYLIEDDTITVAHFTETNSLIPSNTIQSIAIDPATGEVFVGTDRGIASYRSNASEAKSDMNSAYAYPNPVRPDYGGYITITGLMDNTTVNIIDSGGNLVCKTVSYGGTAVWDGRDAYGRRATAGVYTALCNAEGGHAAIKILVIR